MESRPLKAHIVHCAVMMTLPMAVLAGTQNRVSVGMSGSGSYWTAWKTGRVLIGNDRDGFLDEIPARRMMTNPVADGGNLYMPYLTKVPDEDRYLLMFNSRVASGDFAVLHESTDEGETWRQLDVGGLGQTWGLLSCGNNVLVACTGYQRSTDGGRTWTQTPYVKDPRFDSLTLAWDPPLLVRGSNGQHLIGPGYYEKYANEQNTQVVPLFRESFDAGATWGPWRGIPEFANVNEVALAYNAQGEVIAGMRQMCSSGVPNDQYDQLCTSVSTDGGKTWLSPTIVAGQGRHHPSFASLPDGRLVLTYVVRVGYPDEDGKHVSGVEAVISSDGGRTWDTKHRYLLAKWRNDCVFVDAEGNMKSFPRHYITAQNTSTFYLPKSDCLITAYGTGQNRRRISASGDVVPFQCALLKWKPLAADGYTDQKAPVPAPIPDEQALAKLRANQRWAVSYNAVSGFPDGSWADSYPSENLSLRDGRLRVEHRSCGGVFKAHCASALASITGAVGLRLDVRILEDPGNVQPLRLGVEGFVGTGSDGHDFYVAIDSACNLKGDFGPLALPTETGKPFLLEIWADPISRTSRVWVDGKLIDEKPFDPVRMKAAELCNAFSFGRLSNNNEGIAEIAFLQFGEIP